MAARPSIGMGFQFGVETIPGTAVACSKRFPGLRGTLSPVLGPKVYRPSGRKVPNVGVMNTVASMGTLEGPLTYSELLYLLAGYTRLVSSTQIGATTGYIHVLKPSQSLLDAIKTYTVQRGDADAAQQAANIIINSLDIIITRQEATAKATFIGQKINNAATLTATPTMVENVPVSMNDIDVFFDSTFAGIGVTKLTDLFRLEIHYPEKFVEKWVLNSANPSWKEGVEKETEPTIVLLAEYSAQMRAIYDAVSADQLPTRFLQCKSVGENIGALADYTMLNNSALKLKDAKEIPDGEGAVEAYQFEFYIVDDDDLGAPYLWNLTNKIVSVA